MKWAIGGVSLVAAILLILMFLPSEQVDFVDSDRVQVKGEAPSLDKQEIPKKKKNDSQIGDKVSSSSDPWKDYDKEKARQALKDEGLPMGASSYTGPRPLSEEEMDKMDQTFEEYEKGWDSEMSKLMKSQLGMSAEDLSDYKKMRDGYEEDRLEAFESFHERMAAEKGPHYSYSPTQEMIDFDKKLRGEYWDLFRQRYGEEAYARYIDTLERYNAKIRKEADPKYGVITIEF